MGCFIISDSTLHFICRVIRNRFQMQHSKPTQDLFNSNVLWQRAKIKKKKSVDVQIFMDLPLKVLKQEGQFFNFCYTHLCLRSKDEYYFLIFYLNVLDEKNNLKHDTFFGTCDQNSCDRKYWTTRLTQFGSSPDVPC